MSEENSKKYTLEEYVFRDIRIIDNSKLGYRNFVKNELAEKGPLKRVEKYQWIMGEKYKHQYPDAERWDIALESYKKYQCFSGDEYKKGKDLLIYNDSINITADTLTGPSEIIIPAKELGLLDHESIREFCSVAYTIGNVCPVMKNPGGGPGSDTCWYKLYHYLDKKDNKSICSIIEIYNKANESKEEKEQRDINNLSGRAVYDFKPKKPEKANKSGYEVSMFGVFSKDMEGKDIINNLMLNDYYDDDYNLIINKDPQEYAEFGPDEYIKFVRLVTSLIIKRGIRIYTALPGDMKKSL